MSQDTILLIVNAVVGIAGKPLVDWLKGALGVENKLAFLLTVVISIVLGFIATFTTGQITGDVVSVDQVAQAATVVSASATIIFKTFQKS